MAKKPPINSDLKFCQNLKWMKHFEPQLEEKNSFRTSLRDIHPYPDLSTVIYLCKDSYKDQPDPKTIPNSYKRLWSVKTSSSNGGYFGAIYVNESTKQVVLVHRGTKSKAAKADADILFKKMSGQMLSAMTCTHQLKCEMEKSFPKWKLIIAGHSLGSYLTDVSIFSHMYLEPNECGTTFHKKNDIDNSTSITILPYGIGIDGPGSFGIISKLRDMTDVRYGNGEQVRVNDLPVDHYVRECNVVNSQYQQVGGLFQLSISTKLGFLDKYFGNVSSHKLDKIVSAFAEEDLPQMKKIIDSPKNQSERASVNSSCSSIVDDNCAVEWYQVADISSSTTELRFFCSYVQKLLHDFDKVKLYASQLTFLLEDVSVDDREFMDSILTSLQMDERNAILVCSADGMNKQKLVPWINEFFISYPHFMDKKTVICSICKNVLPYKTRTRLQFKRDPFNMDLDSKLPFIIETGNTSIAANEVVATLECLDRKHLLLKASQIELLEKIFKFDGDISDYVVVVVEEEEGNQHDIGNFIQNFDSSQVIIIKYVKDVPVIRCRLDDLTDNCKEDLLSTELCLQGKTVKLQDFVTSAKISDALFQSLLRGGLDDIPECIDIVSSSTYVDIERRLKELDGDSKIFTVREAMKHSKILIISDSPGSGKSTMVTNLSFQPNEWVIKVKLNEKASVLEHWHTTKRNIANSTPEDLLSELAEIDSLLGPLLKCVIEDWKSIIKICVICDAIDEVKADHAVLVIEFVKRLMHEKKISNIIVTTRPHLQNKLRNSFRTKLCPSHQYSFEQLDQLHRQGKLKEIFHAENGPIANHLLNMCLLEYKLQKFDKTKMIQVLHDKLIEIHIKRLPERLVDRNSRSHEELVKLHGKIEKSLQTEWRPVRTISKVHKEIIDLHLNGETDVRSPKSPESPKSCLLDTFLNEKVVKHLEDKMETFLRNDSCPSRRMVCSKIIENCESMKTQSLDAKLSFLMDFSFEELLSQHIKDMLNSVRITSFSLDEFSNEEGIEFITKLIDKPNYPSERVEEIFKKFAWNIDSDVIQTPMMLKLIASKMQMMNEESTQNLSVHSLYSDHIEQVYQQYVEMKAGTNNKKIARESQEKIFPPNLDFYYYFAIKEIFHMSNSEVESYGLKRPCNDTDKELILGHLVNGFRFKHKTFAEFFVAKWLMSDSLQPQAYKLFVAAISNKRGNNILVFLNDEAAGKRSSDADRTDKRKFFEQLVEYYCMYNESGIISSKRKVLTRYIVDGIKKFCGKETLQKILLKENERELLFETDSMDHFEFVLAIYHEAGLTAPSAKPNSSGICKILKSTVNRIIHYNGNNEQYFFAILELVEKHFNYDYIMQLIRDLNKYTVYKVSRDFHIKIFKWQIQFLRTSNREDKLRNLIFDTNDKGTQSPFMGFPHIVHQSLKEMDSPVLNDLPKVFEVSKLYHSSVWERETSKLVVFCDRLSYICLVMFPDQYGDHAANEFKVQFLDHECKMLKNILKKTPPSVYALVAATMLEMATKSSLSDGDVETVVDVIFQCTPSANRLSDHLFTFAKLGSALAMKKLLNGVAIESSSEVISIYTVDVSECDQNGQTALQIAEMHDGNEHKLVVDVIKKHIDDRGDHGQDYNPWTYKKRN